MLGDLLDCETARWGSPFLRHWEMRRNASSVPYYTFISIKYIYSTQVNSLFNFTGWFIYNLVNGIYLEKFSFTNMLILVILPIYLELQPGIFGHLMYFHPKQKVGFHSQWTSYEDPETIKNKIYVYIKSR